MNPNATEFQYNPKGSAIPNQDSFTEYTNMVESIENEMDNEEAGELAEGFNNIAVQSVNPPPSGLPPHLAKHAAEFWFPECRNCSCCSGFKHGCQCVSTNGGVCKCMTGSTPSATASDSPGKNA